MLETLGRALCTQASFRLDVRLKILGVVVVVQLLALLDVSKRKNVNTFVLELYFAIWRTRVVYESGFV